MDARHYNDVIMNKMSFQISSVAVVYSTVVSYADQRKHQSSASLAFVWEIHRWPVNSPHKSQWRVKMFPFDDVIMLSFSHVGQDIRRWYTNDEVRTFLNSTSHRYSTIKAMVMSSIGNISALLAVCAGNSPVTGEFPTQRSVTRSFDVFFDLRLKQQLSK